MAVAVYLWLLLSAGSEWLGPPYLTARRYELKTYWSVRFHPKSHYESVVACKDYAGRFYVAWYYRFETLPEAVTLWPVLRYQPRQGL